MNLTYGATFLTALIKCGKSRFNQKQIPRDTKQHIKIVINNGWNTEVVHIFCEEIDDGFLFKVNLLIRPAKHVEISYEWVLTNFKY